MSQSDQAKPPEDQWRAFIKRRQEARRASLARPLSEELERIGFILLALVLDGLVIPEIGLAIGGALGWGLTAIVLVVAVAAQVWTYARLWGSRPSG